MKVLLGRIGATLGVIVYLLMGLVQLAAILEGLEHWGLHWIIAIPVSLFAGYVPFLGSIAGFVGAMYGWHWPWPWAVILFGPYVLVLLIWLIGGMAGAVGAARRA